MPVDVVAMVDEGIHRKINYTVSLGYVLKLEFLMDQRQLAQTRVHSLFKNVASLL